MIDYKTKNTNECIICRNELPKDLDKSKDSKLKYSKCHHAICDECILSYLKHEIFENKLPVKCPGEKCKSEIEPAFIMQLFKSNEKILNKFLNFTLLKNKDISWCPTPDCNYGFFWNNEDTKFSCPKCKKEYCLKCQCEYHNEVDCKENKKKDASEKADKEFLNLARQFKFKQCSQCKRWIEKKDGCNHITCSMCKYEFCYICGKKYSSSHWNCEYAFIEPVDILKESKESSENENNKNQKEIKKKKLGFDPILDTSLKDANDNRTKNETYTDTFNPFNYYSDLLNNINRNSIRNYDFDFKKNSDSEYPDSSKFISIEAKMDSFLSTSKPIGINNSSISRPLKKDGTLDMRFAVNKNSKEKESVTGSVSTNAKSSSNYSIFGEKNTSSDFYSSGPLKKDGTPDLRYAVNKQADPNNSFSKFISSYLSKSNYLSSDSFSSSFASSGPTKKDGTLDMRFAINKNAKANDSFSGFNSTLYPSFYSNNGYNRSTIGPSYSFASSSNNFSSGPTKKDGTLDMRYSVNKQHCSNYGNSFSGSNYSSTSSNGACGPLRKDGRPDMRYAVNKAMFGGKRK